MKTIQDPIYADLISFLVQSDTLITSDFLSRVFKVGKNRAIRLLDSLKADNNFKVVEFQKHVFQVTKKAFYYQTGDKNLDVDEPDLGIHPAPPLTYEGYLELSESAEHIPSFGNFKLRLVLDEKNEQLIFTGEGRDEHFKNFTIEWRTCKQEIGVAKEIVFNFKDYNPRRSKETAKFTMSACSPSDNWLMIEIKGKIRMLNYDFEIVGCELEATLETKAYLQQRSEGNS